MKLAFLYAGQGSQHPGMGADLYEAYPEFRAVLDSAKVDFDLKTVSFTDPDGVLNQTQYTQPCMVAFAAGMTAILANKGIRPAYAAGLSLGEYSALEAAGVFTAEEAVELAAFRGKGHGRSRRRRPLRDDRRAGPGPGKTPPGPAPKPPTPAWWKLPTTTAPASWSSAATRKRWTRPPPGPRSWAPSGACP